MTGKAAQRSKQSVTALLMVLLLTAVLVAAAVLLRKQPGPAAVEDTVSLGSTLPPDVPSTARHVGAAACAACHVEEAEAWRGSHHDLAMQEARPETVLGDFSDQSFSYYGVTSRFFAHDGKFFVNTDGPDGKLTDYTIKYTFGVWPLQQYLVELPGGRLQALPLAWDARSKDEGGRRWFHLYPDEHIDHRDVLHWTGRYQNWNLQCASCHSTNLRKGYDAAGDRYETRYSELNVACEACHGPGSAHVEWADRSEPPYGTDDDKGLLVTLRSRWNQAWKVPAPGASFAYRDQAADPSVNDVCAPCHARRSTLSEVETPGSPLAQTHRLAVLTPPLYYPDGQQKDEVYVWGSFVQSTMYQKGVTCIDCHEPHTAQLRAQGNALCGRCHQASRFDTEQHHFHRNGSSGAQCVECHMPARNYMVIDARRDHSIRVPRPDLSQTLGSPNACTQCHADKPLTWATAALDQWYGAAWRARPHYGTTLHAGATQGVRAVPALVELAQDENAPSLVRATAATLLQPFMRRDLLIAARALLKDPEPEVRIAALGLVEPADPVNRVLAASPLLKDPVRGVRVEAARILADVPDDQFPENRRGARAAALNEYLAALRNDADWPTANTSLGNLYMRQGKTEQAIAAYERALALDPDFSVAYANLADLYRADGNDETAARILRRGLERLPQAPDLHHALGLLLVREGERPAAIDELEQAAQLAPDNSHYAYVYAVALHSSGRPDKALEVLHEADVLHPNTPEIIATLVSIHREKGDLQAARNYARRLAEALPEDPAVRQLLTDLEGTK